VANGKGDALRSPAHHTLLEADRNDNFLHILSSIVLWLSDSLSDDVGARSRAKTTFPAERKCGCNSDFSLIVAEERLFSDKESGCADLNPQADTVTLAAALLNRASYRGEDVVGA